MKEQSIEQAALKALQSQLEKVPFLKVERVQYAEAPDAPDLQASVCIQDDTIVLLAEIKNNGQPRYARQATYQLRHWLALQSAAAYGIFVAPYISPRSAAICQEAGIGYLDLAGNCFLSFGNIYIHQSGNPNPQAQRRSLRSLYAPKAERILRVLLNEPRRAWKMTELAQTAKVSLGQTANVKKLLLDREWLLVDKEGITLSDPAALLDEWAQAYNFRRNQAQDYYALAETAEIETLLAEACQRLGLQYALTGFSGAARLAPAVRYQRTSAYIEGGIDSLIKTLEWKPVASGANISLFLPYDEGIFYGAQEVDETLIATPVQIYLDLQSYRGRGQEAAQALRREIEKTW